MNRSPEVKDGTGNVQPLSASPPSSVLRPPPSAVIGAALLAYWAVLIYQLGAQWSAYEQYSYGWAVPVLCAYLAWQRFSETRGRKTDGVGSSTSAFGPPTSDLQPPPSGVRLLSSGLLFALALLWAVTRFIHEANPIWRLTSLSLALTVIGISLGCLYFIGGKAWVRHFAWPVAFILVAVPWPSGLEHSITQSLMRLNAAMTVEFLNVIGIPALQRGNVIETVNGLVGVDEACSGIRSLQATVMIAIFFGELYRLRLLSRAVLLVGGVVLDLLFNVGRTFLLTYVAAESGTGALDKWHDPAGTTILVACFCGLWAGSVLLRKAESRGRRTEAGGRKSDEGGQMPNDVQRLSTAFRPPVSVIRPPVSVIRPPPSVIRSLPFALLAWLVVVEVGIELWYRSHERPAGEAALWQVQWPENNPTFKEVPIPEASRNILRHDEGQSVSWVDASGASWHAYFLRWKRGSTVYSRVRNQMAKTHIPEHCMTAMDTRMISVTRPEVMQVNDDLSLSVRRYEFQQEGRAIHVLFAAAEDLERPETDVFYRSNTRERIQAALRGSRNAGYTTFELAVAGYNDAATAQAAMQQEMGKLIE